MYTSKAPPTHQQIQQALVDVKDKEASFIGSKEWIGSFEVSTCLNHLLGVGALSLSLSIPPPLPLFPFLSYAVTFMHISSIQVQCKIHHCSSGSEMAGVGSMLLSHFQTYGTPIMIGKSDATITIPDTVALSLL